MGEGIFYAIVFSGVIGGVSFILFIINVLSFFKLGKTMHTIGLGLSFILLVLSALWLLYVSTMYYLPADDYLYIMFFIAMYSLSTINLWSKRNSLEKGNADVLDSPDNY